MDFAHRLSRLPGPAGAIGLVVNGGFESNGGAAKASSPVGPWFLQTGTAGSWYAQTGGGSAVNNLPVLSPPAGSFAAMTDMSGPGTVVLLQTFTVPSAGVATLSFNYSIVNLGPDFIDPKTLDFTAGPNQQVRVDILSGSAGPFDLGASVLLNVLQPQPGDSPLSGAYVPVSLDLLRVGSGAPISFASRQWTPRIICSSESMESRIAPTPSGALDGCDIAPTARSTYLRRAAVDRSSAGRADARQRPEPGWRGHARGGWSDRRQRRAEFGL